MDSLRFDAPSALWLLLLLPPAALLLWRRHRSALRLGSLRDSSGLGSTWRTRLEAGLPALRLLAVALLIVALARPQRGEAGSEVYGEGVDLVLAFDISTSMGLPFTAGTNRLEAARAALSEFARAREQDRLGLVVFQGSALTLNPLTTDYDAVARQIEDADRLTLDDGTALGLAIAQSVKVLEESPEQSRAVILLTDGENNVHSIEPVDAARVAQALGVRVYTIGVVSQERGQTSRLNVDERALREIATMTDATYNRVEDPEALQRVYGEIDQLEKARFRNRTFTRFDEWAPFLLLAAAIVLAAEVALRHLAVRRIS